VGVLAAVVVLAQAACESSGQGSKGPAAISVGPRRVTLGELQQAFEARRSADSTMAADTAAVRRFVTEYADKVLMEVMALDAVPVLEGTPKQNLADMAEQAMVRALRDQEFREANEVSAKELKRAYEMLGRRLKLGYILVADRGEAEQIMRAVREGAVFSRVAAQKSLDEKSRAQGGDLGWLGFYDLDPSVREHVFARRPGELAGPFSWNAGWQIFRIEEEQPNPDRKSLEEERKMLEMGLRMDRLQKAQGVYYEGLLKKYQLTFVPEQVAWMTVTLREKTRDLDRTIKPAESDPLGMEMATTGTKPVWTEPPIALADTGRVLATFDPPHGRVTPYLVIDQLLSAPTAGWPRFESSRDVEGIIRALVLERLEIREARARGIDQLPAVVAEVEQREKEVRGRVFYRTFVRARARPEMDVVRRFYDAHQEDYQEPERRRFVAINSAVWDNAVRASEMLRAGRGVDEVASALAADTTLKSTGSAGTNLLTYGQSPLLDRFLFRLPAGGVSDPIRVGGSFTVAKVVEIQPARLKPFEEVSTSIQAMIGSTRADSILAILKEESREKHPVRIDWSVVRQLKIS